VATGVLRHLTQAGGGRCRFVGEALQHGSGEDGTILPELSLAEHGHLKRRRHERRRDHGRVTEGFGGGLVDLRQLRNNLEGRHRVVVRATDGGAELAHDREILLPPDTPGADLVNLLRGWRSAEVLHENVAIGEGRARLPGDAHDDRVEILAERHQGLHEVNPVYGPDGRGVLRILPCNFEGVVEFRDHSMLLPARGPREKAPRPRPQRPYFADMLPAAPHHGIEIINNLSSTCLRGRHSYSIAIAAASP
jgi:hypothetical protein